MRTQTGQLWVVTSIITKMVTYCYILLSWVSFDPSVVALHLTTLS